MISPRPFILLLQISILVFSISPGWAADGNRCTEGDCFNGSGTWTYPDGSQYIGNFSNGRPAGKGRIVRPNAVDLPPPGPEDDGLWWGKGGASTQATDDGGLWWGKGGVSTTTPDGEGRRRDQGGISTPAGSDEGLWWGKGGVSTTTPDHDGRKWRKPGNPPPVSEKTSPTRDTTGTVDRPVDGKCIAGDCKNDTGTWLFPDGTRYEGQWRNGGYYGRGIFIDPDGSNLERLEKGDEVFWRSITEQPDQGASATASPSSKSPDSLESRTAPMQKTIQPAKVKQSEVPVSASVNQQKATPSATPQKMVADKLLRWKKEKHQAAKHTARSEAKSTAEMKGKCIEGDCRDGYGVWRFPNNIRYEGYWKNGRYQGRGTLIHPDGRTLNRTYDNGEVVW